MSNYEFVISENAPHLGGNLWQGDPWTFAPRRLHRHAEGVAEDVVGL